MPANNPAILMKTESDARIVLLMFSLEIKSLMSVCPGHYDAEQSDRIPDHPRKLVEHLSDFGFADDQGRTERKRVAGHADEETLVLKCPLHRVVAATAGRVGP